MKLLHTSDWHVGKAIRGASRADEHRAVLDEVAGHRRCRRRRRGGRRRRPVRHVDPVTGVRGDRLPALLALAGTGATVAVIAGNHDNARRLRAVAPLLELGNVHLVTEPTRPDDGGVLALTTRDRTDVRIAMLPFVSKRGIVRAADVMDAEAFENAQRYSDRLRLLIGALCADFHQDTANILVAHAFVLGAVAGGGERPAHLVDEYAVTAPSFPATIGYGALGHLHRAQRIPAGPALHYCGSPLQLDFGEGDQPKQVNVVTVEPGVPADVRPVRLTSGRPLQTVIGTLDELAEIAVDGDPWLRVVVRGPRRAGLADDVRRLLGPRVVDVRVDAPMPSTAARPGDHHHGRSPQELFAEFLAGEGVVDDRGSDALRRPARRGGRASVRPLRLELEGFGAFRDPCTVDFSDIELVALVGATGSGKSTIIDAITFALYGSVARYDDKGVVAPVINQTSTRARVRLDFEVGDEQFTAVRLVQRTARGATTKEARLERGDEILAADARSMSTEVGRLLGLDVDQFNRTVVLPQGRFADFLHDQPRRPSEDVAPAARPGDVPAHRERGTPTGRHRCATRSTPSVPTWRRESAS